MPHPQASPCRETERKEKLLLPSQLSLSRPPGTRETVPPAGEAERGAHRKFPLGSEASEQKVSAKGGGRSQGKFERWDSMLRFQDNQGGP